MTDTNMRILVVEDDPMLLDLTLLILRGAGHTVFEARSGREGIEMAHTQLPDLILLDVVLPDVDGFEVCRRLKSRDQTRGIYITFLSAKMITSEEQTKGLEIGGNDYIVRPIRNRELLARVNAMLRLVRAEKALKSHRDRLEAEVKQRTRELETEIAERKRAEAELRQSREYLNHLFNATSCGILVIDAETRVITDVNSAAINAIGLSREEIVGKVCHNFVCPAENGACPIADLGKTIDNSERVLLTGTGKTKPILKTASPLTVAGRDYYIESFIDISKLKEAETERELLIQELSGALETIKTLRGIVPICSRCKKIRDDRGYWNQLEAYIEAHSDAAFSHGICPACADTLYGSEDWYIEMKSSGRLGDSE